MKEAALLAEFVARCRADQDRLLVELRSYHPTGVMRLWRGRSLDSLREVTEERIAAIERELAVIEATIEFATTIAKVI
jgi:hypothetical protein